MTPTDYANAVGASGKNYELQIYPLGTRFNKGVGGLYALCSRAVGGWRMHYIGQAGCLESRVGVGLSLHHKITAARQAGATHVGVIEVRGGEAARCAAEGDLVRRHQPALNEIAPPTMRNVFKR